MGVADAATLLESVGALCELTQVVESLLPQQVLLLGGFVRQVGQRLLGNFAIDRILRHDFAALTKRVSVALAHGFKLLTDHTANGVRKGNYCEQIAKRNGLYFLIIVDEITALQAE